MKGIILAGGSGSRLYPLTVGASKQLMPVYDKPMIYYPLCTLMLAGIREILIITTPQDKEAFVRLLRDGTHLGLNIQYEVQPRPEGLPQAFIIGRQFVGQDSVALVLGDNIFYGHGLSEVLLQAAGFKTGATVFVYQVRDPERYGVVELDGNGRALSLEEKPVRPRSNYAVTGLYFYDNNVVDIAAELKPSDRGELEITDVISAYLAKGELRVQKLGRGIAWLDTGTHSSLLQAANFVQTLQERQGVLVCCPEEIAYRKGYITYDHLMAEIDLVKRSEYGQYLMHLV
jgi:glucose-1-phosphate thymidylyltransferase